MNKFENKNTISKRPITERFQHRKVLLAIATLLIFTVASLVLAQRQSLLAKQKQPTPDSQISTQSLLPSSPSKEYVYAGSRLIATEEPGGTQQPPPGTNLALNKPATQSSTPLLAACGTTAPASLAVDGNTNGNLICGNYSVTHTDADITAWWQVDLTAVQTIQTIQIYNRTDCCSARLSNYYVLVSDVPFTSTNLNTTLNQPGVSNYFQAAQAGSPTTITVNRTGRYVRVQLTATEYLHIAEVQVWGTASTSQTNIALNKPATQSSTPLLAACGTTAPASLAVDGNTNGNLICGNYSVTHTDADITAWWQVDLTAVQTIQTIQIYNRTDCCSARLSNYYVLVSDVPFTSTNLSTTLNQPGVSNYFQAAQAGSPTTITVNRTGRYVRVQLTATEYLHIAEVQVWGTASTSQTNIALNKPATQSSTPLLAACGTTAPASLAVDGNTNGNLICGNYSVTHTDADVTAWWQVDLTAVQTIQTIQIYNRTDCCSARLSNYYVLVSDVPFTSTNLSTTLNQPGVSNYFQAAQAGSPTTITVNRTGRYVRVQLTATEYLHIAEVQVWH